MVEDADRSASKELEDHTRNRLKERENGMELGDDGAEWTSWHTRIRWMLITHDLSRMFYIIYEFLLDDTPH